MIRITCAELYGLWRERGDEDETTENYINPERTLDGSLPANPVNDRRIANAVTLKSTFCLP